MEDTIPCPKFPKPISPTTTRIGVIGVGMIGSKMAYRFLTAGYSVKIYARTPSEAHELQTLGAKLVDSPLKLAKSCDVIFTMLGSESAVRQVYCSKKGLLHGLKPRTIVIDCTATRDHRLAVEIYNAAIVKGAWAFDAPVSGGARAALDGKLGIFVGGYGDFFESMLPLFDVLGKATYVGDAGSGQICKNGNCIALGSNILGLFKAAKVAKKAGLDLKQWLDVAKVGEGGSVIMEMLGDLLIDQGPSTDRFEMLMNL